MVVRSGLGVGGPQSDVPHVWLSTRDDSKFVHATATAGTALARLPEKNAVLDGAVKVTTGSLFWSGGRRVPMQAPTDVPGQQSFWHRLRYGSNSGDERSSNAVKGSSQAPAGARFGISTRAHGEIHQARVAGNGHSAWTMVQPTRLRGNAFVVQELPLPLNTSHAGATWLKVKVQTPTATAALHGDGSLRDGPVEQGRLTAALNSDMLIGTDYSKLQIGIRSRYVTNSPSEGLVVDQEPLEVYAKAQHNKQRLMACWQRKKGVRVFFARAF